MKGFIEKSVLRRVYLCEKIFENKEIDFITSAKILDVSWQTIKNDIDYITDELSEEIEFIYVKKRKVNIKFKKDVPLLSLTQKIYRDSYFLDFLYHYFEGKFNSYQLSEIEYLSLSKVYLVKKKVIDFFKRYDYVNENDEIEIPEFDFRNLALLIERYTGWKVIENTYLGIEKKCDDLINYIEDSFFNRKYSEEERQILLMGIRIAMSRFRYHRVFFNEKDKKEVMHTSLYTYIKKGIEKYHFPFEEDEIIYIFYLFNTRDYVNKSTRLIEYDLNNFYQEFIEENIHYKKFLDELQIKLNITGLDNFYYRKICFPFIKTMWGDGQIFLTDKVYLLEKKHESLFKQVHSTLVKWAKRNNIKIRINNNILNKFIIQLYNLIELHTVNNQIEIFIIASNELQFLNYKCQLESTLGKRFVINDFVYNSLDEAVNSTLFKNKRIILCDYSCYREDITGINCYIIPVSLNELNQTIVKLIKNEYIA
ncbi:helix-turn-helix domain-containing protein [Enterococcus faecium]|uniref:helix-turn-helix domain-containing protein n=1 Tax=Enterococcus faecium TaxID=1352 RepID=UPI0006B276B1|nr:helix-turn-helix domain-containing protein [Enterococcus faecium]